MRLVATVDREVSGVNRGDMLRASNDFRPETEPIGDLRFEDATVSTECSAMFFGESRGLATKAHRGVCAVRDPHKF